MLGLVLAGIFPGLAMYSWWTSPLVFTDKGAVDQARRFLRGAPTYRFDGISDSVLVTEVETLRMPWTWEVTIAFQCRNSGYGDRTGKVLLPVITPHQIKVVVSKGSIIRAVIDGLWDELAQRLVTPQTQILTDRRQFFIRIAQKFALPL